MKGAIKIIDLILKSNTKLSVALQNLHKQFTAKKLNLSSAKIGAGAVAKLLIH